MRGKGKDDSVFEGVRKGEREARKGDKMMCWRE